MSVLLHRMSVLLPRMSVLLHQMSVLLPRMSVLLHRMSILLPHPARARVFSEKTVLNHAFRHLAQVSVFKLDGELTFTERDNVSNMSSQRVLPKYFPANPWLLCCREKYLLQE